MAESGTLKNISICDQFEDIQSWTEHKIVEDMLNFTNAEKIFNPVIFVIGFVGNVSFILLLARVKMMRTITNFYLVNLAAADLMVLSLQTFTRQWTYLGSKQILTEPFHTSFWECNLYYFTIHLASLSSILLITIVSFDWYYAICHPLKYCNSRM